ncbi:MAG: hypothetical protein DWI23_00165 [Planctomycetota bacterium]|nr:MAG: hypothetical protein DWI23_00165 [Planctomycetota bacterium]
MNSTTTTMIQSTCCRMRRHLFGMLVAMEVIQAACAFAVPINGGIDAPTPDVFYNFYAPPVPAGSAPGFGAQLYVSPRPVPPRVGHTWNTYPPLMPHEFLYKHRRRYIRPAGAMGMKTTVHAYWY